MHITVFLTVGRILSTQDPQIHSFYINEILGPVNSTFLVFIVLTTITLLSASTADFLNKENFALFHMATFITKETNLYLITTELKGKSSLCKTKPVCLFISLLLEFSISTL